MNFKRLVSSRGLIVVTALAVIGVIVWGVRNATPRVDPAGMSARDSGDASAAAAGDANRNAAADRPAAVTDGAAKEAKAEATQASPGSDAARAPVAEEPSKVVDTKVPDATPASTQPAAGLFRDTRPVAPQSPAETASAAVARPTFRDERPLVAGRAAEREATANDAGGGAPSFGDTRPLDLPSFRDSRPVVVGTGDTGSTGSGARRVIAPSPEALAEATMMASSPSGRTQPAGAATSPAAGAAGDGGVKEVAAPALPDTRPADAGAPTPHRAAPVEVEQKIIVAAVPQAPATSGAPGDEASTLVAVAPPIKRFDAADCGAPEITTEALDGGQMRIRVAAPCHKNETVQISYGGAELIRKLDAWGSLDFALDCFAGTSSQVEVRLADGTRKTFAARANDLDNVSKVALIWHAPVNLDLHVFEYGAGFDRPGHIWASAAGSQGAARINAQAERKGHGYLSAADTEKSIGDKIEVYTFFHNDEQSSGSIALALDYETRGDKPSGATCGRGALAEIDFQVVILPRKGQATRQSGVLTRVDCGVSISREARFNQSALPGLRIRK